MIDMDQAALFKALAAFQRSANNIHKDQKAEVRTAKGSFSYTYADLASVIEAIREPLSDNGLCYSQLLTRDDQGKPCIATILAHENGGFLEGVFPLQGDLSNPQTLGGVISYYRRYSLLGILGLATDDDDASSARTPASQRSAYPSAVPPEIDSAFQRVAHERQAATPQSPPSNGSGASQRVTSDEEIDWTDVWGKHLRPRGIMSAARLTEIIGPYESLSARQVVERVDQLLAGHQQAPTPEPQRQVERPLSKKQLETIRGVLPKKGLDDRGWDAFQLYTLQTDEIIRPDQLSISEASQIIEALYALPDQPHLQAAIEASGR